jgi:4-hydroxy-tetrahydrodipicolinate synthase
MALTGILVPLITPFVNQDELNLQVYAKVIDRLLESRVDGIVVAASTGEGLALSNRERDLLISTAVKKVANRCEVVVGCSAYRTSEVIYNINRAQELGATSAMITHPYYSLPDRRELLNHYKAVDRSVRLPLIVYNNPSTTGIDASPEMLAEMVSYQNVKAIKESSGVSSRVSMLRHLTSDRLGVLCGTDNMALEQIAAGATGWVAGVANVLPAQCVTMFRHLKSGDLQAAQGIYARIYPYLELAESTGKYVQVNRFGLSYLGYDIGEPRLPLLNVAAELEVEIRKVLDAILRSES